MTAESDSQKKQVMLDFLIELYDQDQLGFVVYMGDVKSTGYRRVGIDLGIKDPNKTNWDDHVLAVDIPNEEAAKIVPGQDFVRCIYNSDLDKYFVFRVGGISQIPNEATQENSFADYFANRIPLREYLREKWLTDDKSKKTPSNPSDEPTTIIKP